jgi:hypothetical protein
VSACILGRALQATSSGGLPGIKVEIEAVVGLPR